MSLILNANNIKKQYGDRIILEFDNFSLYSGDKVGVVGDNGSGKTTLLKILSRELLPDEGSVTLKTGIAHIRQFGSDIPTMSGGENLKRRITAETIKEDSIIFADEPTSNLDSDGIKWVENILCKAKSVVLVSHDRALLDRTCTVIAEVKGGKLKLYTGNYSDFEKFKEDERQDCRLKYQEYVSEKLKLTKAVREQSDKAKKVVKRKSNIGESEARIGKDRLKAHQKKVERSSRVLRNRLENLEKAARPDVPDKIRINFSLTNPPRNKNIITCEKLSFSYGTKVIFKDAGFMIPVGEKVFITGKNGSGKTTLLNLMYNGHPAIYKAPALKIGYFTQNYKMLKDNKTVLENIMEVSVQDKKSVHSVLAGLLFYHDSYNKKAGILSGGEKVRLSLACLIASENNALFLDEPTNFLDIRSLEAVENAIKNYEGTVVVVSHDSAFKNKLATCEISLENHRIISPEDKPAPQNSGRLLLEIEKIKLIEEFKSAGEARKTEIEKRLREISDKI